MDPVFVISAAIKDNNIIKALQCYTQFLQRIINTLILNNNNHNTDVSLIIKNLINRETNMHNVIINTMYCLLRKSLYPHEKYLISNKELSEKISNVYDCEGIMKIYVNPNMYLPPNFDIFFSFLLF